MLIYIVTAKFLIWTHAHLRVKKKVINYTRVTGISKHYVVTLYINAVFAQLFWGKKVLGNEGVRL